ncbi:sulfotransferase family 2 domain-containing protein [Bacillus sp. V59.32b]|uniref:sulfotransferase family 2 domain-containing protein n=1 Tax=Bacillus sp. V59.32b TaxID=1758642 RepID=UPI000E3D9783|nr:sulfotransferase family 2 domain-containing protein [Bacillus sp. V59.32b]RFU64592.1 hypothetical protein D0463_09850 [Bacillus sp. V59.32b]
MTEPTKNVLIHLHMPKTAGTTLNSIIKKNYTQNEIIDLYESFKDHQAVVQRLESLNLEGVKCLNCHLSFGIHQHLSEPSLYITMLREPIDRVISEYYFIRHTPHHGLHEKVMKMELLEYQREANNMNKQSKIVLGFPLTGDIGLNDFEKGKKNIKKHFAFIGITELFNETIYLMQKQFDWWTIHYRKKNITRNRPEIKALPEHIIQELKRNNEVDYALYSYAKQLLEEKLARLDAQSKEDLKTLMARNTKI